MSKELIRERILSDARAEADLILSKAEQKSSEIIADAMKLAEKERRESETEMKEKTESIHEKKAAAARLESAKILLREKRKVIDGVYALAKERLIGLEKEDALSLANSLLTEYAEEGDIVFFAENYKYVAEVALLPIIKQRGLEISTQRIAIDGGFILQGKKSDKDLSYNALLAADRDEHQAAIAKELF